MNDSQNQSTDIYDIVEVVRARLNDGRHIGDANVRVLVGIIDSLRAQVRELSSPMKPQRRRRRPPGEYDPGIPHGVIND